MEKIALRFDGGHAAQGRLHFYEYTRSQYATARFVTTVEHFRRTNEVAQRITRSSYVEIMVETPKEGSFLEILTVKTTEAAATAVSVQLGSLLSHVWSVMLPRNEQSDSEVSEMARIQLAMAQQQAQISAQETERMRILASIIERNSADLSQALDITQRALLSGSAAYGRAELDSTRILEVQKQLQAEKVRQTQIESDRVSLEEIDPEKLNKLTSRLRPMLPEMALPLKKSADTLAIEGGTEQKPLILLNPRNVAELTEKTPEDEAIELTVHVRSYDRDRGVGKVTSDKPPRQLNFSVAPLNQPRLLMKILDAMSRPTVTFLCRRYFDKSGEPTSLLLEDILFDGTQQP